MLLVTSLYNDTVKYVKLLIVSLGSLGVLLAGSFILLKNVELAIISGLGILIQILFVLFGKRFILAWVRCTYAQVKIDMTMFMEREQIFRRTDPEEIEGGLQVIGCAQVETKDLFLSYNFRWFRYTCFVLPALHLIACGYFLVTAQFVLGLAVLANILVAGIILKFGSKKLLNRIFNEPHYDDWPSLGDVVAF